MKHFKQLVFIALALVLLGGKLAAQSPTEREHLLMDFGWRFALGHSTDKNKDYGNGTGYFSYFSKTGYGDGAAAADFEDRTWREVNLPHDWAAELPFSASAGYSHGYRTLGLGFPETSVGWYRKKFKIPASDFGKKISIQFDGIFRNSTVWVNGFYVGHEQSGYAASVYDITDYLNYDGENVVAVRADASMEEGWFYEGAGIYRHVWLNKTNRLRVADFGTFVSSEVGEKDSKLKIRTEIKNDFPEAKEFSVKQTLVNAKGEVVASLQKDNCSLKGSTKQTFYQNLSVKDAQLWSLENPYLYTLRTEILLNNKSVDQYTTTVGIRSIRFDANQGFFLNGKHVIIKGTNNHLDHAGVGVAVSDALNEFRVKTLKQMGSNAIRASHNPLTPEFIDACDRLGMLILDENRLMGINQEHYDLLERMIKRDRNHPSVILWSLGNEEWGIEGNIKGARITTTMQQFAQTLDSTRNFTVAVSGGWENGTGQTVQIMGYNYIVQGNIDEHHKNFPWQPAVGTEESNTVGTRGIYIDNRENGHMAASNRMPENVGTEHGWNFYVKRPFLAGLFFWTGFDYRGEPYPLAWPAAGSQFGIIDQCGFPKDIYFYLQSWWGTAPVMHLMPHWNWAGDEGKQKKVTIYSNADEVELFLNNKSLGKKAMPTNGHLEWDVTYKAGTLSAKGFKGGKLYVQNEVKTTGNAAKIELSADRADYFADGEDNAVITVKVNDKDNLLVPTACNNINFEINGDAKIIGLGNGDPASHEAEQFNESVGRSEIKDMKLKSMSAKPSEDMFKVDYSDADWTTAFKKEYGEYATDSILVIRGKFTLTAFTKNTEITLYSHSLAKAQTIYVNGVKIAANIKRNDKNQVFKLDQSILKEGENTIVFTGGAIKKANQWENINTNPGVIKILNPAPASSRKVFNGLAQVIVRFGKNAGNVTLKASGENLQPATLNLKVNAKPAR